MESPTNQYMEVINGMEQIMDQRMDDSFKEAVRAAVEEGGDGNPCKEE